jgi:hypothetical protein
MSILKRTVFYEQVDGIIRFWDWALTTTTLGTMAEPFVPNDRHSIDYDFIQYDATDECVRIDEIRGAPLDQQVPILGGGQFADGTWIMLNGGHQLPRDSR